MDEHKDDWEYGYPIKAKEININEYDTAELGVWVKEAQDPEALKALLNFCVNNKNLDKLKSLISEFNPLKILGVSDFEIRHSNVLAWLISPIGHHGLGDSLFKNILLEVLKDNRGGELPNIEDIISANYADVKVSREWRNIDVFAVSHSNKLVVVIENKMSAGESENQLAKYAAIITDKYKEYKKVFVFLTLEGATPRGSELYIPFTHEQIHGIVKSTVEIRRSYLNTKVYDFICQYLQILEEKTMQSAEFIDICSKLYLEHREAIRMILQYGRPKLDFKHFQEFHDKTDTESFHTDKDNISSYYTFVPRSWSGVVPMTNTYQTDKYLVFCYFRFREYENHKITLHIHVGGFPEPEERERFMKSLSEAVTANKDAKLNVRNLKSGKVFTKTISLKDDGGGDFGLDEYDAITAKLIKVYKSAEIQQVLAIVDSVIQGFGFKDAIK